MRFGSSCWLFTFGKNCKHQFRECYTCFLCKILSSDSSTFPFISLHIRLIVARSIIDTNYIRPERNWGLGSHSAAQHTHIHTNRERAVHANSGEHSISLMWTSVIFFDMHNHLDNHASHSQPRTMRARICTFFRLLMLGCWGDAWGEPERAPQREKFRVHLIALQWHSLSHKVSNKHWQTQFNYIIHLPLAPIIDSLFVLEYFENVHLVLFRQLFFLFSTYSLRTYILLIGLWTRARSFAQCTFLWLHFIRVQINTIYMYIVYIYMHCDI